MVIEVNADKNVRIESDKAILFTLTLFTISINKFQLVTAYIYILQYIFRSPLYKHGCKNIVINVERLYAISNRLRFPYNVYTLAVELTVNALKKMLQMNK